MKGFDDIINNLDGRLRKFDELLGDPDVDPIQNEPQPTLVRPLPPTFKVNDVIVIRETRWPPKNGKVNERTGLYSDPGFPNLRDLMKDKRFPTDAEEVHEFSWEYNYDLRDALNEKLVGTVQIGDMCKVLAVWSHEDSKTYYFLDGGRTKGWTRCSFRFRHASEFELKNLRR